MVTFCVRLLHTGLVIPEDGGLRSGGVGHTDAGEALDFGGRHFELEIENGEDTPAAQSQIGGYETGVIAQLGQGGQIYGPYAHPAQTVQDGMVGFQDVQHGSFQLFSGRIPALTVVVLVFAVPAAELPVRAARERDLAAALKTAGLDVQVSEDVGHGTVFGKGVKTDRQFQAS